MSNSGSIQTVRSGREIEIKFKSDLTAQDLASRLQAIDGVAETGTQDLRTSYFDTPSNNLRESGIALRVRRKGRSAPLQGIKSLNASGSDPFARKEIEVRCKGDMPDLSLFEKRTAAKLRGIVGNSPLELKFETRLKRQTKLVSWGHSKVELAFDEGHVVNGETRLALNEAELELKSGSVTDLCELAIKLASELPLRLDFISKAEKGFHAISNKPATPARSTPIKFPSDSTLADAVAAIISNTLAHFTSNWASLRETDNPESIHQMRVALRRLRSGLWMFGKVLPRSHFTDLSAAIKKTAKILGPAREVDVYRAALEQGPLADAYPPPVRDALLAALEECRQAAYAQARALIESADATVFVLGIQCRLAEGNWQKGVPDGTLNMPIQKLAKRVLRKLHSRVLKRGKGLAGLSDEDHHELRIALKNLRYGADFFGELLGHRKKRKSLADTLSGLQDILGDLNDAANFKNFIETNALAQRPGLEKTPSLTLAWHARQTKAVKKTLQKQWKKFRRADRFWE
jgi:triphosphatase